MLVNRAKWNKSADIVVVGGGSAGMAAAITAHDLGAEVLVLEKQPAGEHMSSSHLAGGNFICPSDVSAATEYMEHLEKVDDKLSQGLTTTIG